MSADLAALTARELTHLFRCGEASPVEATHAVLTRIEALNGAYNAFCLVDAESRAARRAGLASPLARWNTRKQHRWSAGYC